jgi:MFS transporter, FSR family, fosmidomycin resistance protein
MNKAFTAESLGVAAQTVARAAQTRFNVLGAISFSHFLNDMMQSLIVAIYPLLKGEFHLSFVQVGVITLTYQLCASVLQPVIGIYTDRHPKPYSLSVGMSFTLIGMVTLAFAPNYANVLGATFLPDIEHRADAAGVPRDGSALTTS